MGLLWHCVEPVIATLPLMPATTPAGVRLRQRIKERYRSQTAFAADVGRGQSWVSNVLLEDPEQTLSGLAYREPETLEKVLSALDWTLPRLNSELGVSIPLRPKDVPASAGQFEIPGGMIAVEIVGMANGGKPKDYGLPVGKENVRGANTRAYLVDGDSMDDGSEDAIRSGDWVLVDISLTKPVNGRVFLLEIIGDGMTVKRLRRVDDGWVFMSDNPSGESWRDDQVTIVGEVYSSVIVKKVR